jgi:ankyrin repeat protein
MPLKRLTLSVCAAILVSAGHPRAARSADNLIDAVREGDSGRVSDLLARHPDVNRAMADGSTALHWAAYLNDAATVDKLIQAGARADMATDRGVTPLMLSCSHPTSEIPARLVRAGADPGRRSAVGDMALMACARSGNAAGVAALLERGADVDATEAWQGQTPLMLAVATNHLDVARALLAGGAQVNAQSAAGFTPLMFSAREGNTTMANLLRDRGAEIDAAARDGNSPLLVATVRGQVDFVRWLLDRGANVNIAGAGYTPLHWVAGSWHTELTGPNGIQASRDEQWAQMGGLPRTVKAQLAQALLKKGADPNARLTRNPPQFGYSSARFKVSLAGATPFLLAAMDGNTELMKLLVAAGADPLLTTRQRTTPLMVAAGLGRVPAESLVTDADTIQAVKLALELGGSVRDVNDDGSTALHGAAHIRLDPLIEWLVEQGADVNAVNKRGLTPLMVAEGSGHSDNPGLVGGPTAVLLKRLGAR